MSGLEAVVGHTFADQNLLYQALSHSSFANEMKAKGTPVECNERLEFLGDSVLSLVVSRYIFSSYTMPEGEMTRIRAATVCEKALGKFARKIDLGSYILLGHGEELSNGRQRTSTLADAFEALLAALYLDGGIEPVKQFLMPFVTAEIDELSRKGRTEDYKTLLQQLVQQEHGELLEYFLKSEAGPPHKRVFTVEAHLNSNVIGTGTGSTKREAEQNAAREALRLFGELPAEDGVS